MNKNLLIGIIVAVVVLIGGYFIFQNISRPSNQQTVSPVNNANQTSSSNQTTTQQNVKEITVVGTEFAFSPSTITVKAGEQVKLNFNNDGSYPHNWVLEGQNIQTKKVLGGAGDTIEFTAPVAGTYTFYCSIPGHREKGLVGQLIVQ